MREVVAEMAALLAFVPGGEEPIKFLETGQPGIWTPIEG
jgi:hypothetical protein